jgi:site-specific recombinase XerD
MTAAVLSWPEAVAAFEQSLYDRGRTEATITTYRKALRVFAEFYRAQLGKPGPYLARLQETDLQAFIDHLRCGRPLKVSSVNGYVAALHGFCQFALGQRWTKRDLARDLKTYSPALPPAPTRLSREEIYRLLTAVNVRGRNGQRDLAIVYLLLHTGMRVGELCALAVGDVTLHKQRGTVRIRNDKGRSERLVALNKSVRTALHDYLESRGNPEATEPLFVSERRQRIRTVTVRHLIKRYLACAGRPKLSVHDLRHHYATELYAATASLPMVQEALGHRSVVTTSRYARSTPQQLEEAVEMLPGNLALTDSGQGYEVPCKSSA